MSMEMPDPEKVKILAVDDSADKLLALSVVLSELHQNVVTARSGRDALRALLSDEFAVVLLDVNMPGMDGFETAALMRQRRSTEHTPIIFITSYGDETHASRGYSLGAVDYILAPVDPEVLKTKVMVFVELFRKTLQTQRQARSLEQKAIQLQKLTEASIAINSALSPDEMLHVVTNLACDIVGANQAVAVAAVDQKWSHAKTAVSLSAAAALSGERPVLRDRAALLSFLSGVERSVRVARGGRGPEIGAALFADDSVSRFGWLASPLAGRDGRPLGLIHVLDKTEGDFTADDEAILTQLAQMTAIAIENTLNAEAREANRIKDEFLTTLSHELRTPLSAILGWTRTLRTGVSDPARIDHGLEVIERNVRAQTKLIDDLLDVSRIITGKLRLSVRPAPLTPIIDAAVESMRPAAEAKEIQISVENTLPSDDDVLIVDADRIQQVAWNLVSNAIKFTPTAGTVRVWLGLRDGQFEIRVSDNGRGIPAEFLPRVFDRFRQADSSTTRAHGGLGIGLAIARHLVELHGGGITADNGGALGGAVFTVTLPRVALGIRTLDPLAPEGPPQAAPTAVHGTPLEGLCILVVEDDPDSRELLTETLETAGARVVSCASARETMALFPQVRPDVLVSDIGMPEEDGYSLIRRIRSLPLSDGGAVPAVAITAYAREEDRLRALAAGFQAHAAKPLDPGDIVGTVAAVAIAAAAARGAMSSLSGPSGPAPDTSRQPAGPAGNNGDRPLSTPALRILLVEDDADSREGLRDLLELWGHAVEVAESGPDAVRKAIAARPGVALIDLGLPELDGFAVAQKIRQALGAETIYLVALTGYADPQTRERALASGFNAHVAKPIDASKLESLLASRPAPPNPTGNTPPS